jgi:predicted PurR-regulated permease PerM
MKTPSKILISTIFLVLAAFLFWYFRSIIIYLSVASVLSLLGSPLVSQLKKIKIGKKNINQALAAFLALIILLLMFTGFIAAFIPLVIKQARTIIEIDPVLVFNNLVEPLLKWEIIYNRYHYYLDYNTLQTYFHEKLFLFFDIARLSKIFNFIAALTGDMFIAVFSISFITFFFLKDRVLIHSMILDLTPAGYESRVSNVIGDIKKLLTRYFIGVFIQVLLIISFVTIGLSIFDVKNALLIGFLAGILNVVPYIGPLIGALIGVLIAISTGLETTSITLMLPFILKIALVFISIQLVDNIVFQPLIYSSSIKAHPLEIFLVILAAGKIGGIAGIILAIPIYTILRVIAKEVIAKFRNGKKSFIQ